MPTFKTIKPSLKRSYDKQNLTLVVISYEMTTSVRFSILNMSCLHDFVAGRVKTQLLTRHDCNIIYWDGKPKIKFEPISVSCPITILRGINKMVCNDEIIKMKTY